MPFKIHVLIALGAMALAFVLWFFIGIAKEWFPWFFIVILFFVITISIHFYIIIRNREFLQCHMVVFLALNIVLILFWVNDISMHTHVSGNLWFIYPLCATGILVIGHYLFAKRESTSQFLITFHGFVTAVLSFMFFFIWLDFPPDGFNFPWFIIVDIILVALYLLHHSFAKGLDLFVLHAKMYGCGCLLLFSIWLIYCYNKFPWFVFPVGAWTALFIFHMFKNKSVSSSPSSYSEAQA